MVPVPLDLLLPFLVASVLVTVIPGADMALVTRQVLLGGPALAQKTVFGNLTGLLVHGVALAAGLSALLVASAAAYTVVKLAGGLGGDGGEDEAWGDDGLAFHFSRRMQDQRARAPCAPGAVRIGSSQTRRLSQRARPSR